MSKNLIKKTKKRKKFLLRQGRIYHETKSWGVAHRAWLMKQRFEWEALQQSFEAYMRAVEEVEARLETLNQQMHDLAQKEPYRVPTRYLGCLKGISTLSALTLLLETQDFRRFPKARQFMSFTGLVGSEHTSADNVNRGSITKAGNAHIRRILVEAAWSFRHRNVVSRELAARRKDCPPEVVRIAKKAQSRLHRKFWRMTERHKLPQKTVTAVARELAGFVWSIGQHFPEGAAA